MPEAYAAASRELTRAKRRERLREDQASILDPDPAWLDEVDVPSELTIEERVSDWLLTVTSERPAPLTDSPVEELSMANARALASFVKRAAITLPVWARKQSGVAPPSWITAADPEKLISSFRDFGLLDFRSLDDAAIIGWARRLDLWPGPLPETIDATDLSITHEELAAQVTVEERERWEREQARRKVALDSRPVTLETRSVHELIDSIRAGVTDALLSTTRRPRALAIVPARTRTSGAGGGGGGSGRRPTSDQTDLVGFMGELVAFEWLKRQYGVGPEPWRSRNRRFVFPHDDGDDSLGYDFEIVQRRPLLFELKATTTDDPSFEMSESELRVASDNAANDRYRIIFLNRVNDSTTRSLVVLPNPLSARGYGCYRVVGRGIRYQFAATGR